MNLEDLKAKAEAATRGRWTKGNPRYGAVVTDIPAHHGFTEYGGYAVCESAKRHDVEYIAAANPQVVLALIRAIEGISLLHVPDQYGACLGCGTNGSGYATVTWPCETAAIIEELEGEE